MRGRLLSEFGPVSEQHDVTVRVKARLLNPQASPDVSECVSVS
jgi:hypothetical protein